MFWCKKKSPIWDKKGEKPNLVKSLKKSSIYAYSDRYQQDR